MIAEDALRELEQAIAALDFTSSNAEISRLDGERAAMQTKADEADAEAVRLSAEIREWAGPNVEALANAMMNGTSAADAAQAAPSREGLVERRDALLATAAELRDRAERVGHEREEVARSQCRAIAAAASGFIAAIAEGQERAAKTIVESDAALAALKWMTGLYVDGERPSQAARRALIGPDGLLGPMARIAVPAAVVTALAALEGKAMGLRANVPTSIANA